MTFRVEISRNEWQQTGGVTIEITAYIDRVPETDDAGYERLQRAPRSVWNSRLLFNGDFARLADALAAIDAAYPDVERIGCYEWPIDYETQIEMAPLVKSAGQWRPGQRPTFGPPPQLDWQGD